MISKSNVKSVPCDSCYFVSIIRFKVIDIQNNQGLRKWWASAFGSAYNTYLNFDYARYHKNLILNNCL